MTVTMVSKHETSVRKSNELVGACFHPPGDGCSFSRYESVTADDIDKLVMDPEGVFGSTAEALASEIAKKHPSPSPDYEVLMYDSRSYGRWPNLSTTHTWHVLDKPLVASPTVPELLRTCHEFGGAYCRIANETELRAAGFTVRPKSEGLYEIRFNPKRANSTVFKQANRSYKQRMERAFPDIAMQALAFMLDPSHCEVPFGPMTRGAISVWPGCGWPTTYDAIEHIVQLLQLFRALRMPKWWETNRDLSYHATHKRKYVRLTFDQAITGCLPYLHGTEKRARAASDKEVLAFCRFLRATARARKLTIPAAPKPPKPPKRVKRKPKSRKRLSTVPKDHPVELSLALPVDCGKSPPSSSS